MKPYCQSCGAEYSELRAKLGYNKCLECGEPRREFASAPAYNKGPYMLITERQLKDVGRK